MVPHTSKVIAVEAENPETIKVFQDLAQILNGSRTAAVLCAAAESVIDGEYAKVCDAALSAFPAKRLNDLAAHLGYPSTPKLAHVDRSLRLNRSCVGGSLRKPFLSALSHLGTFYNDYVAAVVT